MKQVYGIAALAGLLFGFDTGIISSAIFFIKSEFLLGTFTLEFLVSIVLLGALFGSISSAKLINYSGRKLIITLDALLFLFSTLLCAFTPYLSLLIFGRFGVGFAIGVASYIVPLYFSELSPAKMRGSFIALNTIAVTGGIFLSNLTGWGLSTSGNWRLMLGIGLAPAIFLLLGIKFLPESPRWLVKQGKLAQAREVLLRFRKNFQEAEDELIEIKVSLKTFSSFREEIKNRNVKRVLLIGIILAIIQQVTGINTILYYAPILFQTFGFQSITSLMLLTLAVGFINFMMTIVVMRRVDVVGRRSLLLKGLIGMTLSLFALGFFLQFTPTFLVKSMLIISLFTFIAAYGGSIGCIFWIVIAEIYPLNIRGMAMGMASSVNWTTNFIISLTFLTLLEKIGTSYTFYCYGFLCFLSFLFCLKYLPETAQKTLEELESKIYTK